MQALETFKIGANPIEALTAWCFSSLTNLKELDIKNLTSLGNKDNPSIEVSISVLWRRRYQRIIGPHLAGTLVYDHVVHLRSPDDLGAVTVGAYNGVPLIFILDQKRQLSFS